MDIPRITALLQETHNNDHVLDFYTRSLNEHNKNLPQINYKFPDSTIPTCIYLSYLSNKIQNEIINLKGLNTNNQNEPATKNTSIEPHPLDSDIILELTYFSIIGPFLTKHMADKTLSMRIFSIFNEYFFELNTSNKEYSVNEIVAKLKDAIQ